MKHLDSTMAKHLDTGPRIEGLDGIRALAVAAVIVFHADLNHFLPGGFLGVDVFFVLSGFLITSLLFRELAFTGTISFAGFYLRRSRRLLAALFAVLFACAAYTAGYAQDAVQALRNDIPPALLYYSNFWQLLDEQPYFERFGRPHALQHLWSLAIEEQFYIFWPPLLMLIFRWRKYLSPAWIIGGLGLCSILWMGWLAELHNIPYENKPERLYFGTDTHAMGLLLGAFLASCYWPVVNSSSLSGWKSTALGVMALGYLLASFLFLDESSGFLYRGGFASVSLATVLLIISVARRGSITHTLFQNSWAEWLGQRSYSLYLWHWPVFVYFRPGEELSDNLASAFMVRLGLTVLLSDLTYRLIEQPVRMHGLQAFGKFSRPVFAGACVAFLAAFTSLHLVEQLPVAPVEVQAEAATSELANAELVQAHPTPPGEEQPMNPQAYISKGSEGATYQLELTDIRITALGDSVMLGARPVLTRKLPVTHLDAEVGRQGSDLLKLVKRMSESRELAETVLIHIGTNGYIYEQNLKQILHLLRDRKQVVFFNVHADRRWTEDNNALLRKYHKDYDNITLIDWNAAAEKHPEYFVRDGIHLSGKGMSAYAEIARVALGVPEMADAGVQRNLAKPAALKKSTPRPAERESADKPKGETPAASEGIEAAVPAGGST